jgi:predicted phage tail protein
MTTVMLHGELGAVCGEVWNLAVGSVSEALRAIEANTGKLFSYLRTKDGGLAEFRIIIDNKDWECVEELVHPFKSTQTIHIVPVPRGSSDDGLWMTIVGALLIVVAVVLAIPSGGTSIGATLGIAGSGAGFFGGLTTGLTGMILMAGVTLTLSGVTSMLAASSKSDETGEDAVNQPSYFFNGPVNTYRQGNPVPVGYGQLLVGSQVISAGLRTTDLPMITVYSVDVVYPRGYEVVSMGRYYRSRKLVPAGFTPPAYPVLYNEYWTDVTDRSF